MNFVRISVLFVLLFVYGNLFATHNRGGRIEVRHISGYRYEITIFTYTKATSVAADRPTLDSVYMGDGSPAISITRDSALLIATDVKVNVYSTEYIYPGNGTYKIHFADPNRNVNVVNIPNSVTFPFYIETTFTIDQTGCPDFSPHLYSFPLFVAPYGKDLYLSRTASDLNWDSLSFELDECYSAENTPIPGYFIPPGVTVNAKTGEFFWPGSTMTMPGEYNFAIRTKEWRNGIMIGYVHEDFQIILENTNDSVFHFNTAILPVDFSSHILPGNQLSLHVEYFDSISTPHIDFYSDLPFVTLTNNIIGNIYSWDVVYTPSLSHVRPEPYRLQFRGKSDLAYMVYVDGSSMYLCRNVGIDEIGSDIIDVFPVPASDIVHIRLLVNKQIKFTVIDQCGKVVLSDFADGDRNLDISFLNSGIYFIMIYGDDGVYCRRIVKI